MNIQTRGTALATALGLLLGAPAAFAGHDDGGRGWEYAKVVSAEPVYRQVRVSSPREECVEEPVTERTVYRGRSDPGAVLIGGIIGGVIGHQFGSGRGQDIATAAGAVIGAQQGAARSHEPGRVVERTVNRTHCRTVRETRYEDRVDGYDVTYRYHGRLYHTRTHGHPGKRIKVRVDVRPEWDD